RNPEMMGALVRACEACRDVAIAFGMPFISGKDSLNNEYRSGGRHIRIPGTLLVSALGQVPDVRRCVTMDLKAPGNTLYLVGGTRRPELADDVWLVSESPTRWVVEVEPANTAALEVAFAGLPLTKLGQTVADQRLRIAGASGEWLVWAPLTELKAAWQSLAP